MKKQFIETDIYGKVFGKPILTGDLWNEFAFSTNFWVSRYFWKDHRSDCNSEAELLQKKSIFDYNSVIFRWQKKAAASAFGNRQSVFLTSWQESCSSREAHAKRNLIAAKCAIFIQRASFIKRAFPKKKREERISPHRTRPSRKKNLGIAFNSSELHVPECRKNRNNRVSLPTIPRSSNLISPDPIKK